MHNSRQWTIVVVIAAVALTGWLIAGCGGGGGGAVTGVSGSIVLLDNGEPLGGVTVTVGGQQDVSDDDGSFTVTGVPAGLWEVVATADVGIEWYQVPPEPPEVVVVQDQITILADPILMSSFLPPPTP